VLCYSPLAPTDFQSLDPQPRPLFIQVFSIGWQAHVPDPRLSQSRYTEGEFLHHHPSNGLGHRAIFSMLSNLQRGLGPMLDGCVKWFISACHFLQTDSDLSSSLPPTIPDIPRLFRKAHIDTMLMRCKQVSLSHSGPLCTVVPGPSGALFGRKMRRLSGLYIQDILCQWVGWLDCY